ncbi:hypothetical protein GOBAR_DD26483 [Gossypium barbadense]|nr:hypothetical protein GOBAR_DD26483 [Gossypium barbadense]
MNSEYGVGIGGEAQRRTCFNELAEKKLVVMEGCSNHGSMSRLNMIKLKSNASTVLSYSCCNGGPEPDHLCKALA